MRIGDLDDCDCLIDIYATIDFDPSVITSEYAYMALNAMGFRANVIEKEFPEIIDDMMDGNYSIVCMSMGVPPDNPYEGLSIDYRSSVYNLDYFSNSTIDAAIDTMMAATTLEEAKVTSAEVLQLLAHEIPVIPIYNDV
ncbi:MAG: hypothetical protein ACFFDT_20250 [Candidatus Hodarchaeota archaeon]